jgi:hypothetical protein
MKREYRSIELRVAKVSKIGVAVLVRALEETDCHCLLLGLFSVVIRGRV